MQMSHGKGNARPIVTDIKRLFASLEERALGYRPSREQPFLNLWGRDGQPRDSRFREEVPHEGNKVRGVVRKDLVRRGYGDWKDTDAPGRR